MTDISFQTAPELPAPNVETPPAGNMTMDVPLFLRLVEYARESAKSDLDLHKMAENCVRLNATIPVLGIDNYNDIVPTESFDAKNDNVPGGNNDPEYSQTTGGESKIEQVAKNENLLAKWKRMIKY